MVVNFPAYRNFKQARIEANDAMLALLLSNRLTVAQLRSIPNESAMLPSLYEEVKDVNKLNRKVTDAVQIIESSEHHLARMAIPYVLSSYSSFLVDVAKMLHANGYRPRTVDAPEDLSKMSLDIAHDYISECCDESFDPDHLAIFQLSRRIRNRLIHYGGWAGSNIDYHNISPRAKKIWQNYARRPLSDAIVDGQLLLRDSEVIAVLAICKRLAEDANMMVTKRIADKGYWARIVINDYRETNPDAFKRNDILLSSLHGYASNMYKSLELSKEDIQKSLDDITHS